MKNETTKWGDAPQVFIGVDTGNHLVKTRNHIFSNGVKEFEDEPPLTNDVLQMDGVYYAVGGERQTVRLDKTNGNEYRILTLAGITKEIRARNLGNKVRVILGIGAPLTRVTKEKESLISYMKLMNTMEYTFEGTSYEVKLEEVYCFPQCIAAISDRIPNMHGRNIVVDIGSWTKDVAVLEDAKPMLDQNITVPNSIITLYQDIRNEVMEKTNTDIPETVIQNYICGKDVVIPMEVMDIIDRHMKEFATDTEGLLREKGYNPDYSQVIYLGGGAAIMKRYGKHAPNIHYIEDIKANAIGFEMMAKYRWDKDQKNEKAVDMAD